MVTTIHKGSSKEEIRRKLKEITSKAIHKDIMEYAGKLKTEIDPLLYQYQMRNEWE